MLYDYCVIGGGIVGLATAMKLLEAQPSARLVIIEKEAGCGHHQTGHNSGVIHSGIYYAPGSLKADLCRRGAQATRDFCAEHGVPFEVCGKLLVATDELERQRMDALFTRAQQNNVAVERMDVAALKEREPNIEGVGALWVKSSAIVDYRLVCEAMLRVLRKAGAEIEFGIAINFIRESASNVAVGNAERQWDAKRLIVCAGLQSDRLAKTAGLAIEHQIIPFRGEYFRLRTGKSDIVRHLIYPIPNPALPFLGIHLTRMIDGGITVGPNAVLGFAREGYSKYSFNWRDIVEYLTFPGFRKAMLHHKSAVVHEMINSLWKPAYLAACRKYCPALELDDLLPHNAGIRAQAVTNEGVLVHDFLFAETRRMLHVCNAPSPAATSAIPIGEMIARKSLSIPV